MAVWSPWRRDLCRHGHPLAPAIVNWDLHMELTRGKTMRGRDRSRFEGFILLSAIFTLTMGCASTQETSTLQQSVSLLHDRVQNIERRVEGVDSQGQKSADLYSRMEELRMRVGALNGRIDELDHRLQQLARTSAPAPAGTRPSTGSGEYASGESVASASGNGRAEPVVTLPPESLSPERALYDRATQSYQQGKYDVARKEFQEFASKYPKSELADNALFSVGECYFTEKKYQEAIEVYQQVLDRYPKGDRIPHALLKQGMAFQQMGDQTAARILYERLAEKYPDSSQAQLAKKKIKGMP